MNRDQKSIVVAFCLSTFIVGFIIGNIFYTWAVDNSGVLETSFCKEIQVDTLQYNYQQDMYKYEIKLIK